MLQKVKEMATNVSNKVKCAVMVTSLSCATALPAFATSTEGSFDVTTTLATSFQGMATTMLGTISAVLPVVMSVMSAYICIQFGFKFFKRFVK